MAIYKVWIEKEHFSFLSSQINFSLSTTAFIIRMNLPPSLYFFLLK